jgi:hypothetical protein
VDHTTCLASGQTDPGIDRSLSDVPAWPGPLAPPSRTSRASRMAADERGAGCRSLASRTPSHEEWSVRMSFSSGTGIGMVHRIAGIATAHYVETDVEYLPRPRRCCGPCCRQDRQKRGRFIPALTMFAALRCTLPLSMALLRGGTVGLTTSRIRPP